MKFKAFGLVLLTISSLDDLLITKPVQGQNAGDIIIIGDSPEKQAEMQNRWNSTNHKTANPNQNSEIESSVSRPLNGRIIDIANADSSIKRYCKKEKRNETSAYSTYNECLESELQFKYNFETDPEISREIRNSDKRKCYSQAERSESNVYFVKTPWSYRYLCVKNSIATRIRKRDYMKNN